MPCGGDRLGAAGAGTVGLHSGDVFSPGPHAGIGEELQVPLCRIRPCCRALLKQEVTGSQ